MWIHFYDIRTISPKTYVPGIRKKNYAIKNSLNDLQLPPGSKNMHFLTDKWSEKDCNYQNDLKSLKNTEAEIKYEPVYEIPNNVECAISKTSDQPAHTRCLIRACASRLSIL